MVKLGERFGNGSEISEKLINQAYNENKWFTPENIKGAFNALSINLKQEALNTWTGAYKIADNHSMLEIAIVMAGNIPMVGAHDLLTVLVSGNAAKVKLSSKDELLMKFIIDELKTIEPMLAERVEIVEIMKDFDGIIATGSNNSARYFEYYFNKYPNIIRKNRSSVAILDGTESDEQLARLGEDVFTYFGLGCRNVSKLFLKKGYDPEKVLSALASYKKVKENNKYMNNFDYNLSIYILNKTPYLSNDFLILTESESISSPVASLYYEYYEGDEDLAGRLEQQKAEIQCYVTDTKQDLLIKHDIQPTSLGNSQTPALWDYADNVDVMDFVLGLRKKRPLIRLI